MSNEGVSIYFDCLLVILMLRIRSLSLILFNTQNIVFPIETEDSICGDDRTENRSYCSTVQKHSVLKECTLHTAQFTIDL